MYLQFMHVYFAWSLLVKVSKENIIIKIKFSPHYLQDSRAVYIKFILHCTYIYYVILII